MKKRFIKKLLSPIGRGVMIFAVFGLAISAYAAISIVYPPEPHPVGGVVGIYVGLSDAGYDDTIENYEALNNRCNSYTDYRTLETVTNGGAHVCTAMEITNTYNHYPDIATQATGAGLINSGPPGYTVYANDCEGWTVKSHTFNNTEALAAVWSFDTDSASLASCGDVIIFGGVYNNSKVKVACCK